MAAVISGASADVAGADFSGCALAEMATGGTVGAAEVVGLAGVVRAGAAAVGCVAVLIARLSGANRFRIRASLVGTPVLEPSSWRALL